MVPWGIPIYNGGEEREGIKKKKSIEKENLKEEEDIQDISVGHETYMRASQREGINRGTKKKKKEKQRHQIRDKLKIILHICQFRDY